MLTFAYPWLLALLPLPWLLRRWLPDYREAREALLVPRLARIARLTGQRPGEGAAVQRGTWTRELVLGLVWLCVVAALARPQRILPPVTRTVPVRDMLLAVDLSGSMQTKDFTDAGGKKVDRLTAVKQVLDDFLSRRQGDRVGLIFFGNAAFVQAPFTEDLDVCRQLLGEAQVGMAGPKTAIGDAIGLAVHVFEESKTPERVLIVLTDGNDTGSQVPPQEAARVARDRKITIHTVAVGDPKAAGEEALDEQALKDVAKDTGGTYAFAADRAALQKVYDELDRLQTRQAETVSHRPRVDLFAWPLALGLLLTMAYHGLSLLKGAR
jgi:Ca-activated chloride channel family protein